MIGFFYCKGVYCDPMTASRNRHGINVAMVSKYFPQPPRNNCPSDGFFVEWNIVAGKNQPQRGVLCGRSQ